MVAPEEGDAISHERAARVRDFRQASQSNASGQNQHQDDDQHQTEAAAAVVAGSVERAAAPAAEPAQQRDDEQLLKIGALVTVQRAAREGRIRLGVPFARNLCAGATSTMRVTRDRRA
jgi:hypothetical protein